MKKYLRIIPTGYCDICVGDLCINSSNMNKCFIGSEKDAIKAVNKGFEPYKIVIISDDLIELYDEYLYGDVIFKYENPYNDCTYVKKNLIKKIILNPEKYNQQCLSEETINKIINNRLQDEDEVDFVCQIGDNECQQKVNIDIWKIGQREEEYEITKYYKEKSWKEFNKETFLDDVIKELDNGFGYKERNPLFRIKLLMEQYRKIISMCQDIKNKL